MGHTKYCDTETAEKEMKKLFWNVQLILIPSASCSHSRQNVCHIDAVKMICLPWITSESKIIVKRVNFICAVQHRPTPVNLSRLPKLEKTFPFFIFGYERCYRSMLRSARTTRYFDDQAEVIAEMRTDILWKDKWTWISVEILFVFSNTENIGSTQPG